jgi:hypothetical protein
MLPSWLKGKFNFVISFLEPNLINKIFWFGCFGHFVYSKSVFASPILFILKVYLPLTNPVFLGLLLLGCMYFKSRAKALANILKEIFSL